jgi:hypothetical protein
MANVTELRDLVTETLVSKHLPHALVNQLDERLFILHRGRTRHTHVHIHTL